jgi:hypothetical protein
MQEDRRSVTTVRVVLQQLNLGRDDSSDGAASKMGEWKGRGRSGPGISRSEYGLSSCSGGVW